SKSVLWRYPQLGARRTPQLQHRTALCGGSVRLKFTGPVPVFVGPPFRAALLSPEHVGTLAKMLVMSAMPVFVGPTFAAALLLPKPSCSQRKYARSRTTWSRPCFVWDRTSRTSPYGSRAPPRLTCILVVRHLRSASGT